MMKQRIAIIFSVFITILVAGANAQSTTFNAETIPFSIKLNTGWLATELKDQKIVRIDKGEKNSRCFFIIEMETDSISNSLTLEQYFETGFVNIYKRAGTEYTSGDTSIRKLKFLWIQRSTNSVRGYERFYAARIQDQYCHIFCSAAKAEDFSELINLVGNIRITR